MEKSIEDAANRHIYSLQILSSQNRRSIRRDNVNSLLCLLQTTSTPQPKRDMNGSNRPGTCMGRNLHVPTNRVQKANAREPTIVRSKTQYGLNSGTWKRNVSSSSLMTYSTPRCHMVSPRRVAIVQSDIMNVKGKTMPPTQRAILGFSK